MAKNKKPRKPYKPRAIRNSGCFHPREDIDRIKDIINKIDKLMEAKIERQLKRVEEEKAK